DGSGGDLPEPCGRGLRGGHRAVGARRRLFGDPARNREGFAVARRTAVAEEPLAARARTGAALAVGAVGLVGAVPRSELAQGGRGKGVHSGGDGGAARPLAGEPGAAGVLARTPAREVGDAGHGRDADRDAQTRRAALLQEIQGVSAAELLVGGTGRDAVLGVPRRQRARRSRAVARAEGEPAPSAGEREEGR